jgi:hypothetical protein
LIDYLILELPTPYAIIQRRKEINFQFPIVKTTTGFYCDPVSRVQDQLKHLFKNKPHIFRDKTIVTKLQLDGFVVHRLNNLLNFSFSIINEGTTATTASGTYLIGLFYIQKECYAELKPIVTEIWSKIQTMKSFDYEGVSYPVEFKSCSDHKMQALVTEF